MKKLLLIAALPFTVVTNVCAQTAPYGRCDTFALHQANLVLHYNFSGTAPASAIPDLSGHGHTGVRVGIIANDTDAGGNPDCAIRFPGLPNNHIRIGSSTDFDFATQPATISLWYKAYETNPGKYEQLAGRGLGAHYDIYGEYSVGLHDCRRPVAGINSRPLFDTFMIAPSLCTDPGSPYLFQWNHVVAVFNNSGSGYTYPTAIYVNGIAKNNTNGPIAPFSNDTGSFYLGENFKGIMDEVRVYNTAFSASDVSALYAYGIMGCCTPTALHEIEGDTKVRIYPNPSTGNTQVDMPKQFAGGQLHVFNALGQLVFHAVIQTGNENLDLQQLPAGIYVLDCNTAAGDTHIRQIFTRL